MVGLEKEPLALTPSQPGDPADQTGSSGEPRACDGTQQRDLSPQKGRSGGHTCLAVDAPLCVLRASGRCSGGLALCFEPSKDNPLDPRTNGLSAGVMEPPGEGVGIWFTVFLSCAKAGSAVGAASPDLISRWACCFPSLPWSPHYLQGSKS